METVTPTGSIDRTSSVILNICSVNRSSVVVQLSAVFDV